VDSLRSLAGSFVALVRTRVELAVLELREDGERRKDMVVLAAAAGAFLAMAAMVFALFVIVVFWDTHRVAAAGAMTVLYLAVGLFALLRLRRLRAEAPPPFEATLAELARDVEALRGEHE
jgi:uncharacterized membrane protein YqjE